MQHNILLFHEAFAANQAPKIRKLYNILENSPNPSLKECFEFTGAVNRIYHRYFFYLTSVISKNVDEILSFRKDSKIQHHAIIRDGKTINSVVFESDPLSEIVELIAPEKALEGRGFCIAYTDIINEEKERAG